MKPYLFALLSLFIGSLEAATLLGKDFDALIQRMEALEVEMAEIKDENLHLKREKQLTADSIFFATISEYTVPIESGDPIIWDSAAINPGGHFSTVLGAYEAPVHGYYTFAVTKRGNIRQGSFVFLVDEMPFARKEAYDYDSDPSGSATITLELQAGQIVRIENYQSTVIYGTASSGYYHSWFTGHLVYAL